MTTNPEMEDFGINELLDLISQLEDEMELADWRLDAITKVLENTPEVPDERDEPLKLIQEILDAE